MKPENIKKCCELAEGFSYYDSGCRFEFKRKVYNLNDTLAYSTLLHRAVEGWNKLEREWHICRD